MTFARRHIDFAGIGLGIGNEPLDTKTRIPIVMALVGDPVGSGFVPNLNRPGGSVTGASNAAGEKPCEPQLILPGLALA